MINRIKEMDILSKIVFCLMIIAGLLIIINTIKFCLWEIKISTYDIVLLGDNPMIVYQDDKYVESGYIARDYNNKEKNELVKVTSNVNPSVIGKYEVIYEISNFFKRNKVIREVEVVENPLEDVSFSLKGDSVITLNRNKEYIESGYNVISDKGDFSKNVSVDNTVDVTKVGTYEIIYTLKIGNKEKSIKRVVNVIGNKCTAVVDNIEWTNQNVVINVYNHLKDFDYFLNPNNIKVYDESFDFLVDKNGTYEFHLIDKHGVDEVIKVEITNIDKKAPVGACNSLISGGKTAYTIEASDDSGISEFIHDGISYSINSFIVDNIQENSTVSVYDKAGNSVNVSCRADYEYIGPNNKSIYKYESSTLKYWIENAGTYYKTTHIWVKNGYDQLKVGTPSKLGTLNTARTILNKEIKNNGYENKGMVAINASGIVGGGFGKKFLDLKPSWVGTPAIPLVIINGKIIRDSTNQETPDIYFSTYGMPRNGYLKYYQYGKGNDINYTKSIKEKILNDNIKYTFAFYPVLVWGGVVRSTSKTSDIRQAICQIDRNNFVIVTNTNSADNRGVGFNFNDLANYMVKLNCKTGFNLDGGGSVNFYYKGNNETINSIRTSNRGLVDILYFVEK